MVVLSIFIQFRVHHFFHLRPLQSDAPQFLYPSTLRIFARTATPYGAQLFLRLFDAGPEVDTALAQFLFMLRVAIQAVSLALPGYRDH